MVARAEIQGQQATALLLPRTERLLLNSLMSSELPQITLLNTAAYSQVLPTFTDLIRPQRLK